MDEVLTSISSLSEKLETSGHTSQIISVDVENHRVYHSSTGVGGDFLIRNKQTLEQFVRFCTDTYSVQTVIEDEHEAQNYVAVMDIGEKPFKCKHCCKVYSDRCTMRAHEKRHEKSFSYHGSICNKGFYLKRELRKHLNLHDPETSHKSAKCTQTPADMDCSEEESDTGEDQVQSSNAVQDVEVVVRQEDQDFLYL